VYYKESDGVPKDLEAMRDLQVIAEKSRLQLLIDAGFIIKQVINQV
jgi:hypothetical protein